MKRLLLRALFFLIPFLWSIYAWSQPSNQKDCNTTCFSTQVISVEKSSASCTAYEFRVSFSGDCSHALSHYSVGIPCGEIEHVWNSGNWKIALGTDPTTGLRGFKIDDIAGFGEGSESSFTVKFTVCAQSESCAAEMKCWQPVVAYKASTCVNYETLSIRCKSLRASLEKIDATCYGTANGSLSVLVKDGQEPYTFAWSDNSTEQNRLGLSAGNYAVIVRDASGAEVTLEETLSQWEKISVDGTVEATSCNGLADGSIDISVSGGLGPYKFSWNNNTSTEDLQDLPAGKYSVIVTDSRNCTSTANFTVGNRSALNVSASITKPDCNQKNGSIDVAVTGGTSPYSFQWSTGQTTEDISEVGDGVYTITVSDDQGCSQAKSFFLQDNNTLSIKGITSPAGCTDEPLGSVDITITGGIGPYSFTWSNGATTEDITGVSSGFYSVTVKDSKGCTINSGYVVSKSSFQVARTVVQPTCYGENNGSITLQEPVGGTGPFTYEWSNGETGTSVTDLEPGVYSVIITDASGCSRTISTTISSASQILANADVSNRACNAEGQFTIDLKPSGGTAPYTYQWSNGPTSEDQSGLNKGTYTVTITDAHGCTMSLDIVVAGESADWSCLINETTSTPMCSSVDNVIGTSLTDADSYTWSVVSTDGLWSVSASNSPSALYTAGSENSSATFTLVVVKDGCTRTCSVTLSACVPDDSGSDPGEEDPGEDEPGGDAPGGEEPGGTESCEECFTSTAKLIEISGECRTYEMTVNTSGLCQYELSHWTLAIACGTISNYSNSEGWKMEFGKDPTTGLYGLKVDEISSFGKEASLFTVRFTLCETNNCGLDSWKPTVAYKAGQCVGIETIDAPASAHHVSVYPNPFDEQLTFEWQAANEYVSLEIIDQYGNTVSRSTSPEGKHEAYFIELKSSTLPKGMYYYRLTVDRKTHTGKVSKR